MMEAEESNKQGNDSLMRLKKTACLAVDVNHWTFLHSYKMWTEVTLCMTVICFFHLKCRTRKKEAKVPMTAEYTPSLFLLEHTQHVPSTRCI